jgi:cell division protein FtsX
MNNRKQQGATMLTIVLGLLLLSFFVLIVVTLFPVYAEHFSVSSHVSRLSKDLSGNDVSKEEVESTLLKRFGIDDVKSVKKSDISITETPGGGYTVDVEYEVRKPFVGNVDLVIYFHDVSVIR